MENAKPVRERTEKTRLSIGLTAGGIIVATVLTIFIVLAVVRAEEVQSSGEELPTETVEKRDANEPSGGRAMTVAPGRSDESRTETATRTNGNPPTERESDDAPKDVSDEPQSRVRVQPLGGAENVSLFLGSLATGSPSGSAAMKPHSQFSEASLRALYSSTVPGGAPAPEQTPVLRAVIDFLATAPSVEADGAVAPVDRLPISLPRRGYVLQSFNDLITETGGVERVYRVLDGTDGAHLLLRNSEQQWWSVWVYVSAGEIVDLEYRSLSGANSLE